MHTRRQLLSGSARLAGMLATLGLPPPVAGAQAAAYPGAAFEARSMADLMKALGASAPVESREVEISGPDIAENGAAVSVVVSTTLPGAKRLLLLVEKNPAMLAAMFDIGESVDASLSTRVKMAQSSNVFALAQMADGRLLYAVKDIQVTLGGCGG